MIEAGRRERTVVGAKDVFASDRGSRARVKDHAPERLLRQPCLENGNVVLPERDYGSERSWREAV